MAYVTGTANSLADLLSAIQTACTANGWTLSGTVLHKGTCYCDIQTGSYGLQARGGTGIDGSNVLQGATDCWPGYLCAAPVVAWPMTYNIHILTAPDEVYVVVNYAVSYFESLAFGQSAMPGLTGEGNWYCGSFPGSAGPSINQSGMNMWGSSIPGSFQSYTLFGGIWSPGYGFPPWGVHHSLDAATWKTYGGFLDAAAVIWRQPNAWNQESILVPIRVYATRPSGFYSPVLECAHARFVAIANLTDGQIITLGTDKWKVYPWWRRGSKGIATDYYGGVSGITYSGILGHAIRYDGP